jgi:hypothetical protein
MESHEVFIGTMVRVREDRRRPKLQGMLGTVRESYGAPEYLAVDVLLEDGRQELFWFYQLDSADQDLPTPSVQFHDGS